MKPIKETHKRSLAKTITWRLCATFTTILIVFLFTKKLSISLGVGVVGLVSKMCLYYIHERAWGKISWGCINHPLPQFSIKDKLTPEDLSIIHNKLKDLGYID